MAILGVVGAAPPPWLGIVGGIAFLVAGFYALSKTGRSTTSGTYVLIALCFATGFLFLYDGVRGLLH